MDIIERLEDWIHDAPMQTPLLDDAKAAIEGLLYRVEAREREGDELRAALEAQVATSIMLMRRLDFSDDAIADCTAQARLALNVE
jgi:hypothetical protein